MLIREAMQAPKYVNIPTAVLAAVMDSPPVQTVGKGHLWTLAQIARFLWGGKTLEGSTADFTAVLRVDVRSWQRHVPELGRSGGLRYHQPQRGTWVLLGFPQTQADVEKLRAAWLFADEEAQKQGLDGWTVAGLADTFYLHRDASELTPDIILGPTSKKQILKSGSEEKESYSVLEGGCGGKRGGATKTTHDKNDAIPQGFVEFSEDVLRLGWEGSLARLVPHYAEDADRVEDLLTYWLGQSGQYRAAMFWEEVRDGIRRVREDDAQRYITGEFAEYVLH